MPRNTETRFRSLTIETRREPAKAGAAFRVKIASGQPVDRGEFVEVLDLSGVNLERSHVPLLLDHDRTRQIGVVDNLHVAGGFLLGDLRFGTSALAAEVAADVDAGIRRDLSVGYSIEEYDNDGNGTVTVRKWTLHECSVVSIPADHTVGFGRSIQESIIMTTPNNPMPNNASAIEAEAVARGQAITECYALAGHHGMREALEEWLPAHREDNADVLLSSWRRHVLDRLPSRSPMTDESIGLRDGRRFNLHAAIRAHLTGNWNSAGYEREVGQELVRSMGRGPAGEGFFAPPSAFATRAVTTSDGMGAGLIGIEHMGGMLIEALKPFCAVFGLGATALNGLSKDISIPKQIVGMSTEWVAEDSAPTESAPETGSVTMSYHQLSTTARYTRKMLVSSDPNVEFVIRTDGLREIGVAVDRAAIRGSGSGAEPRGVLNTVGIGLVSMGVNGAAPVWGTPLALMEAVEAANVFGPFMGFLTNPATKRKLMSTERASGTAKFILDDANPNKLAGYPAAFSGNVPANGTKGTGTNLSTLVFGNWSDLIIGQFGGLDVILDPYTESAKGNVRVSIHSAWDFAVRHAESFAAVRDLVTTP